MELVIGQLGDAAKPDELVELFMGQKETGVWLADDTSCGVGHAPASDSERVTIGVEHALNDSATEAAHPPMRQDVTIVSVRRNGGISLTVAYGYS